MTKKERKFSTVIFRDVAGFVFASIHDFKKLGSIFHFPNTKTHDKLEFKCLMSSTFSQMNSKNFVHRYQLLQINSMREMSQILVFEKGKISTVKVSIFKVLWWISYLWKPYFQITVHEKWPLNDKWLHARKMNDWKVYRQKILKCSEVVVGYMTAVLNILYWEISEAATWR